MRIDNSIEINTDMKTILDKLILDIRNKGLPYFSKGYKNNTDYIMVQCPYHKMGQERRPSAQFRKVDGLFYCFNCKETHSLQSVIYHCLDVNGKSWLLEKFDGSTIEERSLQFNLPTREKEKPKYINKEILKQYRFTHPYMFERKLTIEVIKKFDVGYDKNFILTTEVNDKPIKKEVGECITFPVKDQFGNIVFIARRSIHKKFFHYPNGVDKPVYGLYEIYREIKLGKEIHEVYICESIFNCLTLWSWGKYAVALNGTGSNKQLEELKKTDIRHFILALDPDDAGKKGTDRLLKALKPYKIIDVLELPKGKDVNDLTFEEFSSLQPKEWL